MGSEEINKLRKIQAYLTEWLANFRKAQDRVRLVQSNLEITDWELEVLNNRPEASDEVPRPDLTDVYDERLRHLESAIPSLPDFDEPQFASTVAYTTSSSAVVFTYVSRIGDLGTPDAVDFSRQYTAAYDEILEKQERETEVRELMAERASEGSRARFDSTMVAIAAVKAGVGQRTAAGNEVRNLLNGIKGDLFQRARKWDSENMTWDVMAQRLAMGGEDSYETQELAKQGAAHAALLDRLASVAKDGEAGSPTNLDYIWTETLDHLYVVLSFVRG